MASDNKTSVVFLSVSFEPSTDQFIKQMNVKTNNLAFNFVKLKHQDLQEFPSEKSYDAVVLLHSISQGRNSITDVANAKYDKLLPQLKNIYGSDHVAVIVHSVKSFKPNTKDTLMKAFKVTQPTTFTCSDCVMQCSHLAELPHQDLVKLIEFLGKAPYHPLPIAEVEAPSIPNPASSQDKSDGNESYHKSKGSPASGSNTKGVQRAATSVADSTKTGSTPTKEIERIKIGSASSMNDDSFSDPGKVQSTSIPKPAASEDKSTKIRTDNNLNGSCFSGSYTKVEQSASHSTETANINENSGFLTFGLASSIADPGSISGVLSTQPADSQTPITITSTVSAGDVYPNNKTCDVSQVGSSSSSTTQGTQASSTDVPLKDQTDSGCVNQVNYVTPYPIALVGLPPLNRPITLRKELLRHLPGKIMMCFLGTDCLEENWHCFESILFVGHRTSGATAFSSDIPGEALTTCQKKLLVPENVALLRISPANAPPVPEHIIQYFDESNIVPIFQYGTESDRESLFDDDTKHVLVSWLHGCRKKHQSYVNQMESGLKDKKVTSLINFFDKA